MNQTPLCERLQRLADSGAARAKLLPQLAFRAKVIAMAQLTRENAPLDLSHDLLEYPATLDPVVHRFLTASFAHIAQLV